MYIKGSACCCSLECGSGSYDSKGTIIGSLNDVCKTAFTVSPLLIHPTIHSASSRSLTSLCCLELCVFFSVKWKRRRWNITLMQLQTINAEQHSQAALSGCKIPKKSIFKIPKNVNLWNNNFKRNVSLYKLVTTTNTTLYFPV